MNFKNLEQKFNYYSSVHQLQMILSIFHNIHPLEKLTMNEIINLLTSSIISGAVGGISGIAATEAFKNREQLAQIINNENFKNFLLIITEKAQTSGKIITRNVRSFNAYRITLVFAEVYKILEENNIKNSDIKPLAEKVLLPAIQSISENEDIETQKDLQNRWSNLLTGALCTDDYIYANFVKILDELSNNEARVLETIMILTKDKTESFFDRPKVILSNIKNHRNMANMSDKNMFLSIDILCKLGLCKIEGTPSKLESHPIGLGPNTVELTTLGYEFIKNVLNLNIPESSS